MRFFIKRVQCILFNFRGLTEVPEWIQSTHVWDEVRLGDNDIHQLTDSSFQWIRTKRLELHNNGLTSIGISDGKLVEVLEGLEEFDEVIVRKKQSFEAKDSGSGFRFKLK